MAGLPDRLNATIFILMEVNLTWEPGPGIRVVDAEFRGERWIVKAEASGEARCPSCRVQAIRRDSFYVRRLQDLPVQATIVELQVSMTRWRCCNQLCDRRTFADQVDQAIKPYARQTRRVAELARLIGYAVGGRPAERLMGGLACRRLMIGSFVTLSATRLYRASHSAALVSTTGVG